ncbi:Dynamitin subunit 2 [Penicillium riverlandense]|uniref:Dynamitin subunit 2 n=1 Tax=Penicillium riverlandense TaxID=1903569 RepID=UPI002548DE55|nr:Dynamitin subunit 2 [Penicillium riverlandense]KAJ5814873.1 Dynamitin subunit 2 [Penicillium riverlandense]
MAFNKKYAGLPDLDSAPDIYETDPPDLTDGASTVPTTTIRTDSDNGDAASDIDREGVNADQARLHFEGAAVDARKANFSDSIAEKRSAYRSKSHSRRRRQRRRREDGTEEVGDLSDSEDEGVERSLARLRREVEDLRIEMENRPDAAAEKAEGGSAAGKSGEEKEKLGDGVAELSRALDHLYASSRGDLASSHSAAALLSQKLASDTRPAVSASASDSQSQSQSQQQPKQSTKPGDAAISSPAPAPPSAGILSHAAAFDSRLALIESSMGISSSSNPFIADGTSSPALQPVLPALEHLSARLSALTGLLVGTNPGSTTALSAAPPGSGASAVPGLTTPHLEALSTRVRKLTTDAEALASARRRAIDSAKAAQAARIASSTSEDGLDPASASAFGPVDDEHAAKINALYATLPTIQSLHPLLPSVLERLRSLRACHAGAAQAAGELDALEKRQAEMDEEIRQWREGLVAVEEKMAQGEVALKENVETVEPWVRDLEKRLAKLGGM